MELVNGRKPGSHPGAAEPVAGADQLGVVPPMGALARAPPCVLLSRDPAAHQKPIYPDQPGAKVNQESLSGRMGAACDPRLWIVDVECTQRASSEKATRCRRMTHVEDCQMRRRCAPPMRRIAARAGHGTLHRPPRSGKQEQRARWIRSVAATNREAAAADRRPKRKGQPLALPRIFPS